MTYLLLNAPDFKSLTKVFNWDECKAVCVQYSFERSFYSYSVAARVGILFICSGVEAQNVGLY